MVRSNLSLLFGFMGVVLAGAALAGPPLRMRPPSPRAIAFDMAEPVGPVALNLVLDRKVYAPGQPIQVKLIARNTTKAPVMLSFSTGKRYDLILHRGGSDKGPVVYQWSRGMMFTMMVSSKQLEAGKPFVVSITLPAGNGGGRNGLNLKPGPYRLDAVLTTMPLTARPRTHVTFTVK